MGDGESQAASEEPAAPPCRNCCRRKRRNPPQGCEQHFPPNDSLCDDSSLMGRVLVNLPQVLERSVDTKEGFVFTARGEGDANRSGALWQGQAFVFSIAPPPPPNVLPSLSMFFLAVSPLCLPSNRFPHAQLGLFIALPGSHLPWASSEEAEGRGREGACLLCTNKQAPSVHQPHPRVGQGYLYMQQRSLSRWHNRLPKEAEMSLH